MIDHVVAGQMAEGSVPGVAFNRESDRSPGSDGGRRRHPEPMTLRATHIFHNEDGDWRLVHRHADFAPVDQSAGKLD
jgi:ketosteroid isomerase-like protein